MAWPGLAEICGPAAGCTEMRIVIADGHGQIARFLTRGLVDRGNDVVGLIRNPEQALDLDHDGATPVVLDLE